MCLVPGGVAPFTPCVSLAEHSRSGQWISQSEGAGPGHPGSDRTCFWFPRSPPLPHSMSDTKLYKIKLSDSKIILYYVYAHVLLLFCAYLFIQRTLQVLLPYLAAKASSTGSALIRTLANELKANRREILINNFKYIFSHLVCSCTKEELERAFHYLQVTICHCLNIDDTAKTSKTESTFLSSHPLK